jgi:hypothetical protein
MTIETDRDFVKRMLAEIADQEDRNTSRRLSKIEVDIRDLERLIKMYAGIPSTAIRAS